jgi:hypothetical protein
MSNGSRYAMVFVIAALCGLAPVTWAAEELIPSITVVGSGKVSAKPDQGEINVGVVTQRPAAVDAVSENSAAVRKVMQRLAELGIAAEDVRTNNLSLNPVYARRDKAQEIPKIIGYEVTNQLHITVRDLDRMGSILDSVVREGANRLNGVSFAVGDPTSLLDEARTKAVEDARRKAELYATASGVRLGEVLAVQEVQPQFPRPESFRLAQAADTVPIAPGQLDFHLNITVIYRIATGGGR